MIKEPSVVKEQSGAHKVIVPIPKEGASVMVTPGTSEHEVLAEKLEGHHQTPVSVQVGTPGLPGWNGIIAQWGAFGVILILSVAMYSFITGMAKDDRLYIQQRDKDARGDLKDIFDRMDRRDERLDRREELFVVTLQAVGTKFDQQTAANIEMLKEFKTGRAEMEVTLRLILGQLKKQDIPPPY